MRMYSIDQEKEKESQKAVEVELSPISKWKRILAYLGDMMSVFMASFVIFNCVVYPIANAAVPYDAEGATIASKNRNDILFGNKILFYEKEEEKYNFDKDLKYTFNRFASYFVCGEGETINPNYPEYAHIEENNIIKTYYVDIRNDVTTYKSMFTKYSDFFDITDTEITLKSEIKENVRFYFDPNEQFVSDDYKALSEVFAGMYGIITKDIEEKDLTYIKSGSSAPISYKNCTEIVTKQSNIFNWRMTICAFITHFLSVIIMHVVIPLINKNGRTITMMVMKIDRISKINLKRISKPETGIIGGYSLAFDLPYVFLLPLSYTAFIYMFNFPLLPTFSILGLLLIIIGLVVTLVTPFNQSLVDLLTRTVIVPQDGLDAVESAKIR